MNFFLPFIVISACFVLFGIGILFFGRKTISAECGTVPGENSDEHCLSHELGMCPMDDKDGYLRMATGITRKKIDPST